MYVRFARCRGRRGAPLGEACGSSQRGELRISRRPGLEGVLAYLERLL